MACIDASMPPDKPALVCKGAVALTNSGFIKDSVALFSSRPFLVQLDALQDFYQEESAVLTLALGGMMDIFPWYSAFLQDLPQLCITQMAFSYATLMRP